MPSYDLRGPEQRSSPLRYRRISATSAPKVQQASEMISPANLRNASVRNTANDLTAASSSEPYASLPYDSLTWQEQGEIPLAVPVAMLFGRMTKKKADIWVYLARTTPTVFFHSYYLDGKPDGYQIIDEVLQKATPSPAFSPATTPMKLLALSTYYFIRKGLAKNYELILAPEQELLLRPMCDAPMGGPVYIAALGQETVMLKSESEPSLTTEVTSIDRYLHLENYGHTLAEKLDDHDSRIDALRKKLTDIKGQLDKEEAEAAALIIQKDKGESEKKRLWDAMSKEDVRELGRRDTNKKRQRA